MTSQTTSIYTPFADGRPVRDIVEHTPALVNETWCRKLLAHTLDSLEQAYASGAPHRAITPDTLVMLANGEALLLPSIDETAAGKPSLAGDLHALALVVHYAITAELPPDGPLGPRLYDNYSEQLTKGLDSCLGPNRRLRPNTVDDMRALLGIGAGAGEVPAAPAAPVQATLAEEAEPVADPAPAVDLEPPPALDAVPAPFVEPAPDLASTPMSLEGSAGVPALEETIASIPDAAETRMADAPAAPDFAAPAIAPAPIDNPVPEAIAVPDLAATPEEIRDPVPVSPEPISQRENAAGAMLRKPANQDNPARDLHPAHGTERIAPNASTLDAGAGPVPAAPLKPSAAPAPGRQAPADGAAPTTWATTDRSSRAQRWGMLAGAAIVVLAAGSALVSYLQQDATREQVPLSVPPAGQAATGPGETAVAPPSASTPAEQAAEAPAEGATDAAATPVPAASGSAAAPTETGAASETVVNGTTYKLLIKPWGTVYVDGVDRGVSPPIKRLTLGPGQHTIRIVNPNFPEHIMTVDAGPKETMIIEHDFTAKAE